MYCVVGSRLAFFARVWPLELDSGGASRRGAVIKRRDSSAPESARDVSCFGAFVRDLDRVALRPRNCANVAGRCRRRCTAPAEAPHRLAATDNTYNQMYRYCHRSFKKTKLMSYSHKMTIRKALGRKMTRNAFLNDTYASPSL